MRRLAILPLLMLLGFPASAIGSDPTDFSSFHSPSGNIGCILNAKFVRCDIRRHTFKVPRKPKSCEFDYGPGLVVEHRSRRGKFVCVSDFVSGGRRLAYGRTIRRGTVRCTSRRSGMTCKNRRGHGFRLARGSYRRF